MVLPFVEHGSLEDFYARNQKLKLSIFAEVVRKNIFLGIITLELLRQ